MCSIQNCNLPNEQGFTECILHCSKENASHDYHMATGELVRFQFQIIDWLIYD